jgi:hypothetical protein
MPRPLTSREREVLDFLVSVDDPAAEALRNQAATARVIQECECGCGGISLAVDREGTPRADLGSQELPVFDGDQVSTGIFLCEHVTSTYDDPKDPEATLWLILQTEDGWIADIEIAWLGGSTRPPKGLPSPEDFSPPSKGP